MSNLIAKSTVILVLLVLCNADPPFRWQSQRLRFPGPTNNHRLAFLAHQEAATASPDINSAPYPAAGFRPEPPFELPAQASEQTYEPPQQTYGPPEQTYGPPEQTYGPPEQTYGPPEQTYGPPEQTYGPPEQAYGPPAETYGPPPLSSTLPPPVPLVPDNNSLPQSASIIAPSSNFFPQTQFALPLPERLIAFRPQRRPLAALRQNPNGAIRRPTAKLRRPPPAAQPKPAKLLLSFSS